MTYREIVENLHSKNPQHHTYVIDAFRTTKFFKESNKCVIECFNADNKVMTEEDIEFSDNGAPFPLHIPGSCEIGLVITDIPDDYDNFVVDGKVDEKLTIINL